MSAKPTDIDGYLAGVPRDARAALQKLRRTIAAAAPDAVEAMSYGLPAFKYRGRPLIYFGAAKQHCALYGPVPKALERDLSGYETSKGTIRFRPDAPLPEALVRKLVKTCIGEVEAAEAARRGKEKEEEQGRAKEGRARKG